MEISLKSEIIAHLGSFPVTNTLIMTLFTGLCLVVLALFVKRTGYRLESRFYNFMEMFIGGLSDFIESTLGDRKLSRKIFPIIVTFFLFIIANNWLGIAPGVGAFGIYEPKHEVSEVLENTEAMPETTTSEANTESVAEATESPAHAEEAEAETIFVPLLRSANSDLNMTLALALFSVIFIQIVAIRTVGTKHYLQKFFNFSSPILFFVGLLEVVSELVKILSFSFRLFGNIFAGDVLLIVIYGLVPYLAPLPFVGMEIFAGFVQALIFAMLTLVFVKMSVSHGEEH